MTRLMVRSGTIVFITATLAVARPSVSSAQTSSPGISHLDIRRATIALVKTQSTAGATIASGSQSSANDAAWEKIRTRPHLSKIQVETRNGAGVNGRLRSVADDALVVETSSGDIRVMRADVWRVRAPDPLKRILVGSLGTMTGGVLLPFAACPYCANEGHSMTKGRLILGGAGSLLFLAPQTWTVYKAPGPR